MEVQVLRNETIKPSSPTPDHLRHYNLSFLDQISPRIYSPIIYYYAINDHHGHETNHVAEISEKLKKSLSETLTLYYPLAGRFSNAGDSLNCNDEGVPYKEATVIKAKLSDVMNDPELSVYQLNRLLPFELEEIAELPLGVQLNAFTCGSVAVGVCVSHRLGDALSVLIFIRTWMAIARGEDIHALTHPEFNSVELFPPKNTAVGFDPAFGALKKNMCVTNVTKRFALGADKIKALRAEYEERTSRRISRIEALSAFLWSRFAAATKQAESEKTYVILHPVNIRSKLDPPLSQHSFGNYYTNSAKIGSVSSTGEQGYSYGLAREISEAIRRVDKGYVEYIRVGGDEFFEFIKREMDRYMKGEVVGLTFSSLSRFPLYEADFGLGEPAWVSSAARGFLNMVGLMDNKAGDGLEAYICLSSEDMAKLEADKEFMVFVSPNIDD